MRRRGFTLIELMIAVVVLSAITAIIYASFATVVNSVEISRAGMEELRLHRFISRSFNINLSTTHADPQRMEQLFQFVGLDEEGPDGPTDSLIFTSTAPVIGGMSLPGDLKQVSFEAITQEPPDGELDFVEEEEEGERYPLILRVTETPLIAGGVEELSDDDGTYEPVTGYEAPSWSAPIRNLDIQYYDGEEWVEEWDSIAMQRLPWCVRVGINFLKTEAALDYEDQERIDEFEEPDLLMFIPIPLELGLDPDGGGFRNMPGADDNDGFYDEDDDDDNQDSVGARS